MTTSTAVTPRQRLGVFVGLGLLVAQLLAGLASGFASSEPDGLERVAADQGFLDTAQDSPLSDGPLADYAVPGVEDDRLSTGLAGVIGVGVTFAFGLGLFVLVKRRGPTAPPSS
jgi:cobalt/nickel transport protein